MTIGKLSLSVLFVFGSTTAALFTHTAFAGQPDHSQASDVSELRIVVIDGEDGVNIVKKKTAVQPVVEVRDRNNLPVAGATVVFATPESGATAAFANGGRTLTVMTDSAGRAAITGMKPAGTGAFKISVSASFHGQVATSSITQTNYLTVAAAHAAGATSSTSASSSGSGGAAGSSAAAGSAGASATGLSTAAIAGIAAGGAAAAGAAYGIKSATSSDSGNQCTSQLQALSNAASTISSYCTSNSTSDTQCTSAVNNTLRPALSNFCSCANTNIGGFSNALQQLIQQYQSQLQEAGYGNVTASNVCQLQ